MKSITGQEILHRHAIKNNDGFLSGQIKWILEAMEEYKSHSDKLLAEKQERLDKCNKSNQMLDFTISEQSATIQKLKNIIEEKNQTK